MNNHEDNAEELVARRIALYGDPVDGFIRIAKVWSGICGHEIQPYEVPLMMAGMKLVRTDVTPDYSDNSNDVDGYMDIFYRIIGDDMIQARTPAEYWAQKDLVPYALVDTLVAGVRAAADQTTLCPNPDCGQTAGHPGMCD